MRDKRVIESNIRGVKLRIKQNKEEIDDLKRKIATDQAWLVELEKELGGIGKR